MHKHRFGTKWPSAALPGAFAFAVFTALGWLFPYVMDDWNWGSRPLAQAWQTRLQFNALNGRYLGNLFGVLLGQERLLRALAVGLTMAFFVWFVPRLAGVRSAVGSMFVLLLLLGMPSLKFREAVSYSSGFANYTLPLLLILPIVWRCVRLLTPAEGRAANQAPNTTPWHAVLLAPMAFAATLFVEHYTLYLCVLLLCANLYVWLLHRRFDWSLALTALASLAGGLLMFSHPSYRVAFSSAPAYQAAQMHGLREFALSVCNGWFNPDWGIAASLLMREPLLSLALVALLLALLHKERPKHAKLCAFAAILFAAWQFSMLLLPQELTALGTPFQAAYYYTQGLLCVLFFASMAWALLQTKALRVQALLLLGSILTLSLPLLVVRPFGQRNFMLAYLLWIALLLLLGNHLCTALPFRLKNPLQNIAKHLSCAACVCLAASLLVVFSFAHIAENRRSREIAQQAARPVVQITPPAPWERRYTMPWHPEGPGWVWQENFNAFHNLPPGTVVAARTQ
ncbi:MAG: hypothetical protein LBB50_00705 [Oscillospiraceae bacterium]|jgi:hypothetical protein|nr:hypothetical protein [Oscillospiraceae bacterium]